MIEKKDVRNLISYVHKISQSVHKHIDHTCLPWIQIYKNTFHFCNWKIKIQFCCIHILQIKKTIICPKLLSSKLSYEYLSLTLTIWKSIVTIFTFVTLFTIHSCFAQAFTLIITSSGSFFSAITFCKKIQF